jgi:hypothetical protein
MTEHNINSVAAAMNTLTLQAIECLAALTAISIAANDAATALERVVSLQERINNG